MLVNAPLSEDTSAEVRTKSDDVNDKVMGDTLTAIVSRIKKVDRDHDIPYIAGIVKMERRSSSTATCRNLSCKPARASRRTAFSSYSISDFRPPPHSITSSA